MILTTPTYSDVLDPTVFKPVTDLLSGTITAAGVVSVLVAALTISLVFVGLWWGVRKAIRVVAAGFRKGRISA